jgi:ubiquinone/menaquinone biosynthesis C-methylase UbiE
MDSREHWEKVYRTRRENDVSWYRPHLDRSLDLIAQTGAGHDARIIDVGGGASTLVDDLLAHGYKHITVLDIAREPLEISQQRLGERARDVAWIVGDVTTLDLGPNRFDVWHDRAVFHFLTGEAQRAAYIERVCCSLDRGGHIILATFGPEGPETCSGLPVARYDAGQLQHAFGDAFRLIGKAEERHQTPFGTEQEFVYCLCRREAAC